MSPLRSEIARCMLAPAAGDDSALTARYRFPPGFTGFQGHFPGQPVLPAVCMVQTVLVMLEQQHGRPLHLRSIVSAKWQAPVGPDAEIAVRAQEQPGPDGAISVRAQILNGHGPVADMRLLVACAPEGKAGE